MRGFRDFRIVEFRFAAQPCRVNAFLTGNDNDIIGFQVAHLTHIAESKFFGLDCTSRRHQIRAQIEAATTRIVDDFFQFGFVRWRQGVRVIHHRFACGQVGQDLIQLRVIHQTRRIACGFTTARFGQALRKELLIRCKLQGRIKLLCGFERLDRIGIALKPQVAKAEAIITLGIIFLFHCRFKQLRRFGVIFRVIRLACVRIIVGDDGARKRQ